MKSKVEKGVRISTRSQFYELLEKLACVSLKGLEEYSARDYLYLPLLLYCQTGGKGVTLASRIGPFIGVSRDLYVQLGDGEGVFYLSPRYSRRLDNREQFEKVLDCATSPTVIIGESSRKLSRSHIRNLPKAFIWLKQLCENGIAFDMSLFLVSWIARAALFKEFLIDHEDVFDGKRYLVTLFDQDYDESLIVQHCGMRGMTTATLQHGVFLGASANESLESIPLCYEHLIADYFLAWNEISLERAVSCGVDARRVLVVGDPRSICEEACKTTVLDHARFFGLVLDGNKRVSHDRNSSMIEYAEALCEVSGMHCLVRFHPGDFDEALRDKVEKIPVFEVSPPEEGVDDFALRISYAIASCSSMYIELINRGVFLFRYVTESADDPFSDVEEGVFSDERSLLDAWSDYMANPAGHYDALREGSMRYAQPEHPRFRYVNAIRYLSDQGSCWMARESDWLRGVEDGGSVTFGRGLKGSDE